MTLVTDYSFNYGEIAGTVFLLAFGIVHYSKRFVLWLHAGLVAAVLFRRSKRAVSPCPTA